MVLWDIKRFNVNVGALKLKDQKKYIMTMPAIFTHYVSCSKQRFV